MIIPRWYLNEVLLFANAIIDNHSTDTGQYKVFFLARHLDDNAMSDNLARWWTDWHEIIHNYNSTPEFRNRMLFAPHRIPPFDTYELWTIIIPLCIQDCYLVGSIVFEHRSNIIKLNQHVSKDIWESLFLLCSTICTVPPML